ncbi:BREX-1 system adenine-specific DNA-methyltransferase PglX [Methanolacinia paynteri]|uniref:BREX-1 system adenine-specific DNA-methyltransferase PglX n=1 Tax=Methanolacinia paynteri TaxID=230356 RepID=UPI00064E88F8|nr:BREX-1 system adenine-specific DNA-methyltransferase PglX [Methanolacinia paynteri]
MDKARVQEFSDTLRERLSEETKARAAHFGIFPKKITEVEKELDDSVIIGGKVYSKSIGKQRKVLVEEISKKGYERVIGEITYTWFNRFVAIRFMEANGYMPVRIFSSDSEEKKEPDLLTKAQNISFMKVDRDYILDLKSEGKDEELYRYLILRLCNFLHETMPFMFEEIQDYSELLFPGRLLHTDSLLVELNDIISGDDWKETEILGWIYQDYIAEKKGRLMKAKKAYSPDQIPAVTQLFTPKWIVQYLVENSLGRLWMLNHPNSRLFEKMDYYIAPVERETGFLRISSPEEIRVCDPACGSGHILVYAFDLLYEIYKEEGYLESEIPGLILSNNLYGIEIDRRAGSIAAFALVMKAKNRNRRFFDNPVQPQVCVLENISFEEDELEGYMSAVGSNLFSRELKETILQFTEADNFGSLIRPASIDPSYIRRMLDDKKISEDLILYETHKKVLQALEQAEYLEPRYHVVVANPPYIGNKGLNAGLKKFAKDNYPDSKSDLFAMFIERNLDLSIDNGLVAMITMQSWMFLSSFEKLREKILDNDTIITMAHFGPRAFDSIGGEVVSTTAFVIENAHRPDYQGAYVRLVDGRNESEKKKALRDAILQSGNDTSSQMEAK